MELTMIENHSLGDLIIIKSWMFHLLNYILSDFAE